MKKIFILLTFFVSLTAVAGESSEVLSLIDKVQSYWQSHNTPYCRGFWDNAAYFTGNMEAYRMSGRAEWYQYSDQWCRHNQWKGAKSDNKAEWKYKWYGEGDDFVLFGDWQICFQTYVDMYHLVPAKYKVARAKEVMGYECDMADPVISAIWTNSMPTSSGATRSCGTVRRNSTTVTANISGPR